MTQRDLLSTPFAVPGTTAAGLAGRTYQVLDRDAQTYASPIPGRVGGHRRSKTYGHLDCPAARRAITARRYLAHRVFLTDEETAVAAEYRPCAVCMPEEHRRWKHT